MECKLQGEFGRDKKQFGWVKTDMEGSMNCTLTLGAGIKPYQFATVALKTSIRIWSKIFFSRSSCTELRFCSLGKSA